MPVFMPESLRVVAGLPKILTESHENAAVSLKEIEAIGCNLSSEALTLFKQFNGFKKTFQELQNECNLKSNNILAILTELELSGLVHSPDNFQFYFNGAT
jgi:DNA processing protein